MRCGTKRSSGSRGSLRSETTAPLLLPTSHRAESSGATLPTCEDLILTLPRWKWPPSGSATGSVPYQDAATTVPSTATHPTAAASAPPDPLASTAPTAPPPPPPPRTRHARRGRDVGPAPLRRRQDAFSGAVRPERGGGVHLQGELAAS